MTLSKGRVNQLRFCLQVVGDRSKGGDALLDAGVGGSDCDAGVGGDLLEAGAAKAGDYGGHCGLRRLVGEA